jgi:hypothetical protein
MTSDIYIDQQFIARLGFRWRHIGQLTYPISHHCETGYRKRLYIVKEPHNYLVHCFNCGYSKHFAQFLKDDHPHLYEEYLAELRPEPTRKPLRTVVAQAVELPPWQFSRKEALRLGATHYQGKPCDQCLDHCTRRRVSSGVCAHCDNLRRYDKFRAVLRPDDPCPRCQGTLYYKSNGKCVNCSRQSRHELGIVSMPGKKNCRGCHQPAISGSYIYCQRCSIRLKRRTAEAHQYLSMRTMLDQSYKSMMVRFGREIPKTTVVWKGLRYWGSSDRMAVFMRSMVRKYKNDGVVHERILDKECWIPLQMLKTYGTDPDDNPIVPVWYFNNPWMPTPKKIKGYEMAE